MAEAVTHGGRTPRSRRARGERGSVLVEAAFITPVLFFLLFSILEFGMAFRDYLAVANTTRDGARAASVYGNDSSADFDILQTIADSGNVIRSACCDVRGSSLSIHRVAAPTRPMWATLLNFHSAFCQAAIEAMSDGTSSAFATRHCRRTSSRSSEGAVEFSAVHRVPKYFALSLCSPATSTIDFFPHASASRSVIVAAR